MGFSGFSDDCMTEISVGDVPLWFWDLPPMGKFLLMNGEHRIFRANLAVKLWRSPQGAYTIHFRYRPKGGTGDGKLCASICAIDNGPKKAGDPGIDGISYRTTGTAQTNSKDPYPALSDYWLRS